MEISEFGKLFARFNESAFRLETLPHYLVDEESRAFALYLEGRPFPERKHEEWLSLVSNAVRKGKLITRVHAIVPVLTPYLRFELEWFYPYNVEAGEDVRILEDDDPQALFAEAPFCDFWIFDDTVAVKMEYDAEGRFLRPSRVPEDQIEGYRQSRAVSLDHALPLATYLALKRKA
jgi:hypothetical protein